ncbi:hypothetical protein A3G67_04230 [Candidatus Roizmanbacteria bacterium RIFCSPLOWO2_12_FULL_40_12]|uniref:Bacterial Ig domain-containing protein n=1 Tax=Candidatus Roizmanbacteria bacterium RIFCSPLOWO2_01_FULL_40_42 TaxID=1802066 RepID=A0A1F7J6R0_9BACT|nr:MAG: hypothetical protein A2779_00660 [Candidatus Roizmanbacteria bacterium RIFCSPHIGHO2_01_FULL_40_98]OGK29159.1 MAG: hypothetical protein A3C31_02635 [Candidatus Roizmanbacteria bacterium RIFCSPHIGHO2_02_FULL_40_53]OGK30714.1 MAG: hypothetical protein A2W49_01795 [Candidatus Roizmanbacteria bacterium RIFCSPHIGHO2_12_41_18]OGK37195.1 MAG: hypothetical protein A3E69_01845 [Candidatus Roizmanbacteria bacterium RIFCSPHIGHO2_12_FULL_40_130]OGK51269.1 MAG: hypothetical protein A3B50_04720 [Candi
MPTRLEQHEKKQIRSRLITMAIVLGLFLIFMITIGLPLLINGSVFIGKLFGGGNSESEKNVEALGDFNVNEIPSATNSADINISGNVENLGTLEIFLNGSKVDSLNVEKEQEFASTITGLNIGENQIYFIGKVESSSATKKSQAYVVTFRNQKPKLEVNEPQDNTITPRDEIKVAGKTDLGVSVFINDSPAIVDSSGGFQTQVKLKEGENKIKIVVQDSAGNSDSKELTVKYEK